MRKLTSKREEEKRKRRNQFIVGGVLIFLMLFATLGYAFQSWTGDSQNQVQNDPATINYKGFEFADAVGFWTLSLEGSTYVFRHNPFQVPEIQAEVSPLASYSNRTLSVHSEDVLAEGEISANLKQHVFGRTLEKIEDVSALDCTEENAIIITHGPAGIRQEGRCVYLTGPEGETTKITDEFLFRVLGIRQ